MYFHTPLKNINQIFVPNYIIFYIKVKFAHISMDLEKLFKSLIKFDKVKINKSLLKHWRKVNIGV